MTKMDWLIVTLVGILCITPQLARSQDSITYCIEVGRLARDIARTIDSGLAPEKIQFAYPNARPDELQQAEEWGENLKLEVIAAMKLSPSPDVAAQMVMEACAFRYGAQFKKTGSADATTKQQYCYAFIRNMRKLYANIKQDGAEKFIAEHPPEKEGYPRDKAEALGAEIEKDGDAQKWLQGKWDTCIAERGI